MQNSFNRVSLVAALVAATLPSQGRPSPDRPSPDRPSPSRPCDSSRIEWVLPGHFEVARKRAVAEQRMILIKGISFGVDEKGASCATAGTW
ncbi:MAG: hypothetical protein NXI31_21830 [bacterium]|nr:hypothetical protein [bacterium]